MKKSTKKRLDKRQSSLPAYFVDSSVFVEALLRQPLFEVCISFFHRAEYKYSLGTSTVVIGEVVKALNEIEEIDVKEKGLLLLKELLMSVQVNILPVSFECIGNIAAIRDFDCYLPSSDSIIFSSAITESCAAFVTLDSHFTPELCREFKILLRNPSDA